MSISIVRNQPKKEIKEGKRKVQKNQKDNRKEM